MRRIWELQPPPGSLLSNTLKDIPLVGLVMLAWPAGSGKTGMLLKLAYRGEDTLNLEESPLENRSEALEQLDIVTDQLLTREQEIKEKNQKN